MTAHDDDRSAGPAVTTPRRPWRGEALLRTGELIYRGELHPTGGHAHHAVQVLAATSPISLTDADGRTVTATTAVIPANARHHLGGHATTAVMVYLDPASPAARMFTARTITVLAGTDAGSWTAAATGLAALTGVLATLPLVEVLPRLLHALSPTGAHHPALPAPAALTHPATARAVDVIERRLAGGPVRLEAVAAAVRLSPDRLGHLFIGQVGLPFRAYVRWRRLQVAVAQVAAGSNLTVAAHTAGFADSAHLTRTSRRTFGLAPSALTGVRFDTDR